MTTAVSHVWRFAATRPRKILAKAPVEASGDDDDDGGGGGALVAAPYVWLVVGDAGAYDVLMRMVYRAELSCSKVLFFTAMIPVVLTP